MPFGIGSAFKKAVRHPKKTVKSLYTNPAELLPSGLQRQLGKLGFGSSGRSSGASIPQPGEPGSAGFDERYYGGPAGDPKDYGSYLHREPGSSGGAPPSMGGKGSRRDARLDQRGNTQSLSQQGPDFNSGGNPFAGIAQSMGVEGAGPSQGRPPPAMGGKGGHRGDSGFIASNPLLARATGRSNNSQYAASSLAGIPNQSRSTGSQRRAPSTAGLSRAVRRGALPNMNTKTAPSGYGGGNV